MRFSAQPNSQPPLAQAQSNAQAANAKADLALAQSNAISAKISKPTISKPLEWAANTTVSGRMFFNASRVTHEVNGVTTGNPDNGGGVAIKRMYLGVDHKFNDTFFASVTMDADNVAGTTNNLVGKGFYIKKAYLQAKVDPALIVELGAADLPWLPYVESIYGYRHIEKTLADRTSYGTTADWGLHALGSLAGGAVSYQISAIDGAGYRDVHFSRTIDLEARVSAKYKGFNLALGGYTGKLGKNLVAASGAPLSLRTYSRFDALAAFQGNLSENLPFTLGVEYLYAWNKALNLVAPIAKSDPADSSEGYSVFASASPVQHWSVFGKYERLTPSRNVLPTIKDDYYNLGIQWSPARIVDLALVYKHDQASNGALSLGDLQSGVIGCSTTASTACSGKGTYDEFGLFGQFRF